MDLGTLIIGLIMVALCALPFILAGNTRKSNEQKIKKSFADLVQKNNINITQNDFWYNASIGINTTSHELLFYRKIKDIEIAHFLHLTAYQKSKVICTNDTSAHIEKLVLILTPLSKSNQEISLEFYNAEVNPQLNGEVQLIEKWNKIINEVINTPIEIKKAV